MMAELLAVSVTINLFVVWRFLNLHRIHSMTMRLLFKIARGEAIVRATEEGMEIKMLKN